MSSGGQFVVSPDSTAISWKWLSLVPWPITAALAMILLSITMTFVAYAAKWLTVGQVGRMGMTRPVAWLARAPLVDPAAAVAPPPALRTPETHDAGTLTSKLKSALECQDQLLGRIGIDLAHRLRLAPAGPTKPAYAIAIVGQVGKTLLAEQIAAAIGWPAKTVSARSYAVATGGGLRDKVEAGDTGTVLDQLLREKAVVIFDHVGDVDQVGQRTLAELASGTLSMAGRSIAANQVIVVFLAENRDRLDPALLKAIDQVYELAELDEGGQAKVGIRMIVEAGERNKVGFRPSPDAVAMIGSMAPRDAARLLDGLAAEATAAGVAGEAVVDVGVDGRVVLVRPF